MMKFIHKIHLWLSVPFGAIITLVCFSGAMLVFEPEITRWIRSDVYYVSSRQTDPIEMGRLMETVKATLPDSVSITGVTVFNDKDRTYQVNLSKPRRASIFIDQYSGRITGKSERIAFFSTMFKMHRWLLDNANLHGNGIKTGKMLVGISTLVFVIALLTGVAIWWPRARKNLRRNLTVPFKNGWKGLWKGLHVAGGMYALIVLLAMSLTGLTWSFGWYRSAFYKVCGVEYSSANPHAGTKHEKTGISRNANSNSGQHGGNRHSIKPSHRTIQEKMQRDSEFCRWQQVYNELARQNPCADRITIGRDEASVTLGVNGNTRAADRYEIDRHSGKISNVIRYAGTADADKLRGWIYSIHTGNLGGMTTRILWFLGALIGASLPLTGYYIWVRHLKNKKHPIT